MKFDIKSLSEPKMSTLYGLILLVMALTVVFTGKLFIAIILGAPALMYARKQTLKYYHAADQVISKDIATIA